MPLFDYECSCGSKEEVFCRAGDVIACQSCGRLMDRLMPSQISINMGVPWTGYHDETLGKFITTNKQRREECARQGVTPRGDTPKVFE
jgi:hypothetical protein